MQTHLYNSRLILYISNEIQVMTWWRIEYYCTFQHFMSVCIYTHKIVTDDYNCYLTTAIRWHRCDKHFQFWYMYDEQQAYLWYVCCQYLLPMMLLFMTLQTHCHNTPCRNNVWRLISFHHTVKVRDPVLINCNNVCPSESLKKEENTSIISILISKGISYGWLKSN